MRYDIEPIQLTDEHDGARVEAWIAVHNRAALAIWGAGSPQTTLDEVRAGDRNERKYRESFIALADGEVRGAMAATINRYDNAERPVVCGCRSIRTTGGLGSVRHSSSTQSRF